MRGIALSAILGLVMWCVIGFITYKAIAADRQPTREPYTVVGVRHVLPPPRAYVDEIAPNIYRIHDPETGVVCYRHGASSNCAISCVIPPQWHTAVPYED